MQKGLLSILCYFIFCGLYAQKPFIDSSAIDNWPSLGGATLSNNGIYVSYTILNQAGVSSSLVIQDMEKGWKRIYENAQDCQFSEDNLRASFKIRDSLCIFNLPENKVDQTIAIFSLERPRLNKGEWLSFRPKNSPEKLVILNVSNGKEYSFDSVEQYYWEDHGKGLLLKSHGIDGYVLKWFDPNKNIKIPIWSAAESETNAKVSGLVRFDTAGTQLCFLTWEQIQDHKCSSLWHYYIGARKAAKLIEGKNDTIMEGRFIKDVAGFSAGGNWIFLHLQNNTIIKEKPNPDAASVDIYSYKDFVLQSQQLKYINERPAYLSAIAVTGGSLLQLEQKIDGESFEWNLPVEVSGNHVVVCERLYNNFKPWWLISPVAFSYYLESLKDGSKTLIASPTKYPIYHFSFSPDDEWLIYWDGQSACFTSYNIRTGQKTNISRGIPNVNRQSDYVDMFEYSIYPQPVDRVRWLTDSKSFLLYTMYDIWQIDPSGKIKPINLTNGFGLKHHLLFRFVYETTYKGDEQVLLTAFNPLTKENGFFELSLKESQNPRLLIMGPYSFYRINSQMPTPRYSFSDELQPVKAKNSSAWVFSRQTADEFPNYFYTRDWKKIIPISDLEPQKEYNWLTSELITWKELDGKPSQGILYKPANFDPKKKYPLIFNYYEHLSYRLYEFPIPEYTANNINIPWFVSRGYLVFTPDNHYTRASTPGGKTFGESVYNSVVSAATYLSSLPYVDARHMAIQGHSFGGGETNYLVTHTNLFAAACSASGTVSDEISAYLGPHRTRGGFPDVYRLSHAENGHEMIGATLWERPDLYFRSSSVFTANHVKTPLLLMHNENDPQTDWGQSFELYNALRRLGKPVWLLQYDNEGHSLNKKVDQKDFTIRLTQFFDHYLKGALPPTWMTHGISAKNKGIDQGFTLDSSGAQP